jgi:hypothetical protein
VRKERKTAKELEELLLEQCSDLAIDSVRVHPH